MRRAALMAVTALVVLLPASPASAWTCGPPDMEAPVVELETGADPMNGRIYLSGGQRYVVTADASFRTSYCEAHPVYDGDDLATRPADVRDPVADGRTGPERPPSATETVARGVGAAASVGMLQRLVRLRRRRQVRETVGPFAT